MLNQVQGGACDSVESHPRFKSEMDEAVTAELFGDIKVLDTELRLVAQKIDALGPSIEVIDKRWLAARSIALSNEFESVVAEVLARETRKSLETYATEFSKASDRLLNLADDNGLSLGFLIACIAIGSFTGVAATCVTVYLLTGGS